ncbi:P-loop containing nucleoside triphosphate hydrolases superfamily protein [Perilla frutescens var. frutescens]|nr:P-loop containing nucleoside triphosphate hydrolases superfamily protein [Perilla frutescens var. frutescens]
MGRSDDSISRRRSKRIRRKAEDKKDSSSKVSSRVAAFIAAKKRRQTGKRRQCQGMCFSLPSPADPFNDREGKPEPTRKRKFESKEDRKHKDKKSPRFKKESIEDSDPHENLHEDKFTKTKVVDKRKIALVSCISFMGTEVATNLGKPTHQIIKRDRSKHSWEELVSDHIVGSPSKFLIMCLNTIQNALHDGAALSGERDKPLFADAWGLEFWNCYCTGKDVLEVNGVDSKMEQIAWIASTAADIISMKEKEGISFTGPFLLYLVPSQDKASEVRGVCKQLKVHGIHTVSLHSGAPIDHQINGLNNCEPEFLVSTPERLLDLLASRAVDVSGVSLLVIDGLESPFGAYFDAVKSIRRCISGSLQTVVFCGSMNKSVPVKQKLLPDQSTNGMKLSSL